MCEVRDLIGPQVCTSQWQGRKLWSEPLVWAFSADKEIPSVLPLAFFPEPCPYREAAMRALAGSEKQWRIASTCSSVAGVRAAAMAGLALTPLPLQSIRPGLRILDKSDKMPPLPEVEFMLVARETDTRPAVSALVDLMQQTTVATRPPRGKEGRAGSGRKVGQSVRR